MKRSILLLAIAVLFSNFISAQVKLSDYKYIIIPKQFPFQNEPDEYDLNRLVSYLFEKHGFNAIIEGQTLPEDLISNYCLALNAELKVGGALRTKAQVFLRDCENNLVFTSAEGSTKIKDFRRAYEMAIRDCFESFQELNYSYIPTQRITSKGSDAATTQKTKEAEQQIEQLKAEITVLKQNKEDAIPKPVKEKTLNESDKKEDNSINKKEIEKPSFIAIKNSRSSLYKVYNSSKKVIMELIPSGRDNLFIVKDENAILFKEDGIWRLSKVKGDKAEISPLNITFQ